VVGDPFLPVLTASLKDVAGGSPPFSSGVSMPDISDNTNWFETDANNNKASPNGWPEGMMPSGVNDSARANMGALKRFWDKINPVQAITPSGGAWTFNTGNTTYPTAYVDGEVYTFRAASASVGGDTFAVNALAAKPIWKRAGSGGWTPIAAQDITGQLAPILIYSASLNSGAGGFVLENPWVPVFGGLYCGQGTATSNWAETLRHGWTTWNNVAVLQALGGAPMVRGLSTAMRTSDPLLTGNEHVIGLSALSVNDNTSVKSSAWGGYFEVWRKAGCMPTSVSLGIEIDIAECNNVTNNIITPFNFFPTGLSAALWIASGANLDAEIGVTTYPASCAIGILNNTAHFRKGIVFASTTLDTTIGGGGLGVAIELARGQSVRWLNSGSGTDGEIWADATGTSVAGSLYAVGTAAGLGFAEKDTGVRWVWSGLGGGAQLLYGPSFTATLGINSAGDVTVTRDLYVNRQAYKPGGGSWVASSGRALKQDIEPYGRGLDAVCRLDPVSYRYNGKGGLPTGSRYTGLIAEDVQPVMPELVGSTVLDAAGLVAATIDPSDLTYALVNCVKELNARLTALEAK
jgi:hypothetical protein